MTVRDEPRNPISPRDLLGQLRGMVGLLAASADQQRAWLVRERYPTDELALQFLDAVPAWVPRLAGAGVLTNAGERALLDVRDVLENILVDEKRHVWQGLPDDGADWVKIREAASRSISELDQAVDPT